MFYSPSAYESFGIAAAEALCAGCSVVAGRSVSMPSFEWFVSEKSGTLAERDNAAGHSEALRAELDAWNGGRRDAQKISDAWCERLHADKVARQVLDMRNCRLHPPCLETLNLGAIRHHRPMDFTIITPSLNYGRFLGDCLESVAEQQGVTLEHLIIDGGSTDDSAEVAARFPHATWSQEPDKGMSDAINKGFHRAQGDWVMWLNADDRLKPGALAAMLPLLEKSTADVVYGDWDFVDEAGNFLRHVKSRRGRGSCMSIIIVSLDRPPRFIGSPR